MTITKTDRILQYTFLIWAASTLSFMAAMSTASAFFLILSFVSICLKKENLHHIFKNSLSLASILFFVSAIISIVFSYINPPLDLPIEKFSSITKFHYFLMPFLVAYAIRKSTSKIELHSLWKVLYWVAIIVSIIGIIQFWASYIFPESWLKHRFFRVIATGEKIHLYHAQGLMFFHLSFASAMGFIVSYVTARVFWPLETDTRILKIACWILLILSSLALFFSFSRIAWVALAAIFIFLSFLKKPRYCIATFFILLLFFIFGWNFVSGFSGRWSLGLVTLFEREGVWAASIAMIKDRLLTGVGFGKTGYYSPHYAEIALGNKPLFSSHAHNNLLDVFASTGIFGLSSYLLWWIVLWIYAWQSYQSRGNKHRWLPAACLAGCIAFHINGLTQVNFFDGKSQHALMLWAGIVLSLHLDSQKDI